MMNDIQYKYEVRHFTFQLHIQTNFTAAANN